MEFGEEVLVGVCTVVRGVLLPRQGKGCQNTTASTMKEKTEKAFTENKYFGSLLYYCTVPCQGILERYFIWMDPLKERVAFWRSPFLKKAFNCSPNSGLGEKGLQTPQQSEERDRDARKEWDQSFPFSGYQHRLTV